MGPWVWALARYALILVTRKCVPVLMTVSVPIVPLGGYRWYTVGTVRAVGPWTVDSPVGALVGP